MRQNGFFICVLLLCAVFACGAAAEEMYFEESFLPAGGTQEQIFDEAFFGGEDFFPAEPPAPDGEAEEPGEDGAADRSVVSIPNEESVKQNYDWQKAPANVTAEPLKENTVLLAWEHAADKLPKNVLYYVYERQADGTGTQVGKTAKKTLTLKNVPGGSHKYFVRAEYVNAKKERELYGARSAEKSVTVASALWQKAPALTAERTGDARVTLTWAKDTGASSYQVKVWHGGELVLTKDNVTSGTYTDTSAVAGKNTYEVRAYNGAAAKYGAAAKKTVTLPAEAWMTAPVVRKAVQLDAGTAKISFSHSSPAESYVIAGAGKTQTVAVGKLSRDAETGWFSVSVPLSGTGKKKVTVQPQGKNESGKTVKGTKSAAFQMVSLKETLLGATDVTAVADGNSVSVSWNNPNGNRIESDNFRIYLFNKSTKKLVKGTMQPDWTGVRCKINSVANGTYKVFVRILTGNDDDIADSLLYDTVNLEMPEVTVTGIAANDLKVTLSQTSVTLYEQTNTTKTLTATNSKGYDIVWSSSDPSVATVSGGKVTAKKGGTCYITAKTKVVVDSLTAYGTPVSCKVTVNPAVYRAVVIAEKNPHWNGYYDWYGRFHKQSFDAGVRFDNDRQYLETMLKGVGYSTVKTAVDISKAKTASLIKETFKDADKNDVSLVFFSCHGYVDRGAVSGALAYTDGTRLTATELAEMLESRIPAGRVAVFLGSCGSGALIEANGMTRRGEEENWGQPFIEAFADLGGTEDEELVARYDELSDLDSESKKSYYVMTAAERHESSSGREGSAAHCYNYFATWIGESAGYLRGGIYEDVPGKEGYIRYRKGKATSGEFSSPIPGDANGDRKIGFKECFNYVYDQRYNSTMGKLISYIAEEQYITMDTPLKYSSGADFPLFRR